ncbi:MAG: 2-oxoacid:acceptor oxidoreductase family protein [Anaerolineales bacterium]|nr:2-oxoacid:acceptor oxidoreductase family protein [Anaerolineales bacterium]
MQTEIVVSGFGGQGALFAGQLLAFAGMDSGKFVTWIPSYGPEMRGGTAHCTVIVGDEEIGSPVVRHPKAAIVMNLPSLDKYEPLVHPGGVLVVNASLVDRSPRRGDIDWVMVRGNEVAEELGDKRMANVVLLGALLSLLPALTLDELAEALRNHIPARRRSLLDANLKALHEGAALAERDRVLA